MSKELEDAIRNYAIDEDSQYKLKRLLGRMLEALADENAENWRKEASEK